MLTNVLTGAERAKVLSAPLRAAQGVELDRFGAWMMGPLPVIGPKLPRAGGVCAAHRQADPPRAGARHARAGRQAPRCRVLPGLHDERCDARREPGNDAGVDAARLRGRDPARSGVLRRAPGRSGDAGSLRDMARQNIALFEPILDKVEAIVTDCAGCSAALKEYVEWLHDDPAWAEPPRKFCAKVRDVTKSLGAEYRRKNGVAPGTCGGHLSRSMSSGQLHNTRTQPRRLLGRWSRGWSCGHCPDGHPFRCCGSAGIYNLTHTPMALGLLDKKMADVAATGAELVVSANPGCLLQLSWGQRRSGQKITIKHVVQVFDKGLDGTNDQ